MNDELDGGIPLPQAFGETKADRSLSLRPICRIQGQSVLYREPYPKKKAEKKLKEPKEDSHKWAGSKKDSKVLLDRRSDLSQAEVYLGQGLRSTLTCAYSLSIAAFF